MSNRSFNATAWNCQLNAAACWHAVPRIYEIVKELFGSPWWTTEQETPAPAL